jgi:hypothetical protein
VWFVEQEGAARVWPTVEEALDRGSDAARLRETHEKAVQ